MNSIVSSHFTKNPLFSILVYPPIDFELEYHTLTISVTGAFKSLSDLKVKDCVTYKLVLFGSDDPVYQVPPPVLLLPENDAVT